MIIYTLFRSVSPNNAKSVRIMVRALYVFQTKMLQSLITASVTLFFSLTELITHLFKA